MKKSLRPISLCLAVLFLASSCLSSPEPADDPDSRLTAIARELKTLKLAPGEVWSREIGSSGSKWSANAFTCANDMLALDGWFDFQSKMGLGQVAAFSRLLFKDLPVLDKSGDLRVVAVGGVYPGSKPLIVIISQVQLKEGVIPGRTWGLKYMTNSAKYKSEEKATGMIKLLDLGTMFSDSVNYSRIAIPYANGDFVFTNNLDLGKTKIETLKDDVERANAMDTFIKDEAEGNDVQVALLREAVEKSAEAQAEVKVLAKMNWGLYLLKTGRADEAEALWNALPAEVPATADPSMLSAITKDSSFLLAMWRSWQ